MLLRLTNTGGTFTGTSFVASLGYSCLTVSTKIKPEPDKSDSLLHADQRIIKLQAFLFAWEVLNCVKA